MRLIDRLLFYKLAPRQVKYIAPPNYSKAAGLARAVVDQLARDFVVGPPITIHMANPELMAGVWAMGRECLAAGGEGRASRELVAAEVSRLNQCPYCFDVHGAMLHAFRHGDAFTDPAMRPTADWAAATLTPNAAALCDPPFSAADRPKMLGTAVCFHYLNRMANVFLDSAPFTFHASAVVRLSGRILRPLVSAQHVNPGEFLTRDAGTLPAEFAWAESDVNIAGGLSRFAATAEAAGEESIEPDVRARVIDRLSKWSGESPSLGWKAEGSAVERLALLTALASWQVDEKLVGEFRRERVSDRDLINTAAWGSYTAARRIGSWLR